MGAEKLEFTLESDFAWFPGCVITYLNFCAVARTLDPSLILVKTIAFYTFCKILWLER